MTPMQPAASQPKAPARIAAVTGLAGSLLSASRWAGRYRRYRAASLDLAARAIPAWRTQGSRRHHLRQIEQECRAVPTGETIFVSIASYRDSQCPETVLDIFEKAACPFRVFVGVCQQNHDSDPDVLEGYRKLAARRGVRDFSDHIRVHDMHADEALGPMPARRLVEERLYRDERYYLIIDSHTMLVPRWDAESIAMWTQARELAPKPILTMHPDDFRPYQRRWPMRDYDHRPPSYMRLHGFHTRAGVMEFRKLPMQRIPERPVPSLSWIACFAFGAASQIREVPFDPHCTYIFYADELSMAARLWTWGYDFFHPIRMVVYHMWQRQAWKRRTPSIFDRIHGASESHRQQQQLEQQGYQRFQTLIGLRQGRIEAPYGLGAVRTLADYQDYIGVDIRRRTFTAAAGLGLTRNSTPDERLCKLGSSAMPPGDPKP